MQCLGCCGYGQLETVQKNGYEGREIADCNPGWAVQLSTMAPMPHLKEKQLKQGLDAHRVHYIMHQAGHAALNEEGLMVQILTWVRCPVLPQTLSLNLGKSLILRVSLSSCKTTLIYLYGGFFETDAVCYEQYPVTPHFIPCTLK